MFNLKYIHFVTPEGEDAIITFPSFMNHNETIKGIRHIEVVSAGFVSPDLQCFGRSESLNIDSNPEADTKLLQHQIKRDF